MKKTIVSFAILSMLMISMFSVVSAATDDNTDTDTSVDIPEAKRIGAWGGFVKNLRLSMTFNQERKAELALEFAEEYLASIEAIENEQAKANALERYNRFVERAENAMNRVSEEDADSESDSESKLEKLQRMEAKLLSHKEKAEEIYLRQLENAETDEEIERIEERYAKALERVDRFEANHKNRKTIAETRHAVLADMTDEEREAFIAELKERSGLKDAREKFLDRSKMRLDKFEEFREKHVERLEERLEDADLTEEEREKIEEKIETRLARLNDLGDKASDLREQIEDALEGDLSEEERAELREDLKNLRNRFNNGAHGGAGAKGPAGAPGPAGKAGAGKLFTFGGHRCGEVEDGDMCLSFENLEACLEEKAKERCGDRGVKRVLCSDDPDHPKCAAFGGRTHAICTDGAGADDPAGYPIGFYECAIADPELLEIEKDLEAAETIDDLASGAGGAVA